MPALHRLLLCAALAALTACGDASTPATTAAPASAPPVPAVPADAKLARLYEQTCKACHATGAGGAPIAGDREAWAPRAQQGLQTLLERTLNGYRGMPPLGSCSDCTQEEFEALIRFMAGLDGQST